MTNADSHLANLAARYTARTARSKEVARSHRAYMANRQFFEDFCYTCKEIVYPLVAERARGSRFWDLDGNEYVDYCMGFGAHLLGFSPPFIQEAVGAQLERGVYIGPQSSLAAEAASRFCATTGCDRVFFSNTGTEAMMTAIRLARAVTRRTKIATFGAYHGHNDQLLVRRLGDHSATAAYAGIPRGMTDDVFVLPYGTSAALDFVRGHGDELAAVVVDPIPPPQPGDVAPREFLRGLREACHAHGAALLFDEVITGLRFGARGAQGWFGVDADLAAYGKVLAGGLPIAAVGGSAKFLDAVDGGAGGYGDASCPTTVPTFAAGTFCRHPLAMAAAVAVLRHVADRGPALYEQLDARAEALARRLREAAGTSVHVEAMASMVIIEPRLRGHGHAFYHHLALRGVYARRPECFISTAHGDEDCDRLVAAVRSTCDELAAAGLLA
jgi:glutamate-1-semialdehyde aminotransferase